MRYGDLKKYFIIFATFPILISACSENEHADVDISEMSNDELVDMGKEVFFLKSPENNISCADCHGNGTNNEANLTKFFSNVKGANKRPSTYLGRFTGETVIQNAAGATVCWEAYLAMKSKLSPVQISALNAYYESLITSPEDTMEVVYETIALPERDKRKLREEQDKIMQLTGNIENGKEVFLQACVFCHSPNSEIRKVPSLKDDFEGNIKGVVFMTRLGDGAMPFYRYDKLSDQQIADLSAFIMSLKEN